MSCLVSPLGWRLYFSKYWKVNFFVSKKEYLFIFFKTRLFFEIILSLLNKYFLIKWNKNILKFSTFRIFLNFNTVYVLINYKIYWKNIFSEFDQIVYKKNFLLKKNYSLNFFKKNLIHKFLIKKHISLLKKFELNRKFKLFFFFNTKFSFLNYIFYAKKIIFFFFFLPQFIFLKYFLSNALQKIISYSNKKIFFFGLNQKNFNMIDVLELIEFYLRNKFRTMFVFYKIIKILKLYKKLQKLYGFKILLAGRFSRRDRATFIWKTFGNLSLSSKISNIEYFSKSIILQYSKCIVKIWLCRG